MLPPAPDYDSLVAAFRWRIPERYNIGVDVCDRWAAAEPERPAILEIGRRRARRNSRLTVRCGSARTASRTRFAPAASAAATVSRSCCPRVQLCRSPTSPCTSSARSRCRSRPCSASTPSPIGSPTPGRRRSSPTRPGSASFRRSGLDLPGLARVISTDGAGRLGRGLRAGARGGEPGFHARRHRAPTIRR